MTKSKKGERGSGSSSVSSNTELKKSKDERRRRGNKFNQGLNSKLNGEYGKQLCESPYVRESMTVLDSGFHAVDSGFQLLDSGFQLSGFRIPKRAGFQFFFLF